MTTQSLRYLWLVLLATMVAASCGDDEGGSPANNGVVNNGNNGNNGPNNGNNGAGDSCSVVAADALQTCLSAVSTANVQCYVDTGASCSRADPEVTAATNALEASLTTSCSDGEFLPTMTTSGLVGRLSNACVSEAGSLAWRSFGGPQGAVWTGADAEDRDCLRAAHDSAANYMARSLTTINDCLADDTCDTTMVSDGREQMAAATTAEIEMTCSDLESLIAVSPQVFVERATHQVDCLVAAGHADTTGLGLRCGPSFAQFDAPRGEWTRVDVDGDTWGTMCGDGSGYAFYIRPAPAGERLDRVLIGLQGGGVCIFEDDCGARMESDPGLFTAADDEPFTEAVLSDDPTESPFANYTKVLLPYCTQDVHAGGGVVEVLGDVEVPRFGAVNVRSAVQMVRDFLWRALDEETPEGFRPDEVIALFGGWSAGGYGTIYNYHWFVDDLQWPRTTGFPDAGLALDNGSPLGVAGLGLLKIPAWGTTKYLPPYCFAGNCSVGPVIYESLSPRLKTVPEQQLLIFSNPKDDIQRNDAFFQDDVTWINAIRQSYCDTKDLPGIHYYLTSVSEESVHVVTVRPELWTAAVDGAIMHDWMAAAVSNPDNVEDKAEEGDFAEVYPGVEPYPCEVAP